MTDLPKKPRRWLAAAIAEASRPQPALPFARGNRRRVAAFPPAAKLRQPALAAR